MHTIKRTAGDVLEVTLFGRVTPDDYEAMIPAVESSISDQNDIRLVYDISGIETLEPSTIWADVVFDMRHRTQSQRIAIVASKQWKSWATRLFRAQTPAAVRVFRTDRHELAQTWVRHDSLAA